MRFVAQGFVCVYARLHMAATPDKRRAVRASQRSDSVEKVEDAGNASYCRREAYLPARVTECVTVSGGTATGSMFSLSIVIGCAR